MERYAVQQGDWSDTATWNGGTLPAAGDDVHANDNTVFIDQDIEVASIRNDAGDTAAQGGRFIADADVTITADVVQGADTNQCLTVGDSVEASVTLVGEVTGGPSGFGKSGVRVYSGSSLSITGDVAGGAGTGAYGVYNDGSLTIVGNVTGGSGGTAHGVFHNGTAMTVTGNVTGGSGGNGIDLSAPQSVTITGDVTGGSGVNTHGVRSSSTANVITVTGDLTAGNDAAINCAGTLIHNGQAIAAADGLIAVRGACRWLIDAEATIRHTYRVNDEGSAGDERLLATGVILPASPGFATLSFTCYDQAGAIEAGVLIQAQIIEVPTGDLGVAYDKAIQSATSDEDGIATLAVAKGATYRIRRGGSEWFELAVGQDDVQTIGSVIGLDGS